MSKRRRRNYPDEFKNKDVKLVTYQDYSATEAARNRGINANLPGHWKKELEQSERVSTSPGNVVALQTELQPIRKENKQLNTTDSPFSAEAFFFKTRGRSIQSPCFAMSCKSVVVNFTPGPPGINRSGQTNAIGWFQKQKKTSTGQSNLQRSPNI